jgi:hypothetical protein
MVRGSNPGWGKIFRTHPDRPWVPPSLLYNRYWVSFPGVKWPGHGVDHLLPSCAEVKERVEQYLYSPSGLSWPVLGWTLVYPVMFNDMQGLILNRLLVSSSRSILALQMEVTAVATLNRNLRTADERWSSSLRIWWGSCSPWLQKTSMLHSAVPQVGQKMGGWWNAT